MFLLKTEAFAKLFFLISCTGLLMYAMLAFYTFHTAYSSMSQIQKYREHIQGFQVMEYEMKLAKYNKRLKYILIWTVENETHPLSEGQNPFIERNCYYTDCYVTTNKNLMEIKTFEAILFDSSILKTWRKPAFPESRWSKQKYIFYSKISSHDAPVCSVFTDNYFNWTWTYRLDSDIVDPFIEVKNTDGVLVAPAADVTWESRVIEMTKEEIQILNRKKKAVAWISTECETRNDRMTVARRMQRLFKENSLEFDIFGCGQQECPSEGCNKAVENDYYFYFAPEDSTAKDYVTKEVVTAYNLNAVPIVLGGADYKKFLPAGSYLNAGTFSIEKLIAMVAYYIKNPKLYQNFHRWRKHYTISVADNYKGICDLCEFLNSERYDVESVKKNFRKWWYSRPLFERCFPKGAENLSDIVSYMNESRRSKFRLR